MCCYFYDGIIEFKSGGANNLGIEVAKPNENMGNNDETANIVREIIMGRNLARRLIVKLANENISAC